MLSRKLLRKTEKKNLLLGRSYVSIHSRCFAVLTGRLQLREGRKANLEKHVESVNVVVRGADVVSDTSEGEVEGEEKPWDGILDNQDSLVDQEDEYTDDDRFTTVTVEAVDVSKDGLQRAVQDGEAESEASGRSDGEPQRTTALHRRTRSEKGKRIWTKEPPSGLGQRKMKFRYENKAERKATRYKERSGNKAKARARKA